MSVQLREVAGARASASSGGVQPSVFSRRFILSFALLWALGLAFLWWPIALLRALRSDKIRRLDGPLLLIFLALGGSLLAAIAGGAPILRISAAGYNAMIWLVLLLAASTRGDLTQLLRGIRDLAFVQAFIVIISYFTYPALKGTALPAARLLPAELANDPAISNLTRFRVFEPDYFGQAVLRTGGILGNPTWGGMLTALGIIALVALGRQDRLSWWRIGILGLPLLPPLYWAYSRNTYLALLGCALVAAGVILLRRFHASVAASVMMGAALLAACAVLTVDAAGLFESFNSQRAGSLDARTGIYSATWERVVSAPVPIFGAGYKERVEGVYASLGSHSGYLGILYRGGWIAFFAFVYLLLRQCAFGLRAVSPLVAALGAFQILWLTGEDFDAGHVLPLASVPYFLVVQVRGFGLEGEAP